MAALVPVTDKQIVFLHDLDDACFTQDGDLVFTKKSNAVDNGDGTATLTNPDGTTVTVSTGVGGTDTDTTYVLSLPNGVDGDGDIVFRLTDSNGVVNNITIPEAEINTDTIIGQPTLDQTTGILTIPLTDVNGTALPAKTVDLSVLMDNVDTDTIPTALAFDDATSTITLSRTDIAGTALADLTATLPVATALPCEVTVSTGFATDLWVNDFINRGVQFNNAALTNVSNACTRAVMASADATVNNGRSAVISSNASTASGIGATIIAANGATLDGEHTAVIAAQNVTVDGDYGITTGTGSTVVGNRNLIGGLGNTISADRTVAWGNTLMADGAENGALFGSANTDEGLNNLTSGASNTNAGTGTLLTGNGNTNSGFANLVGGNINVNAGDRGLVTGGGNVIEAGAIANTVANGQNTIRAGSVGCNAWGRGNEVTAPLYTNVYGQYTIAPDSDTSVWGYAGAAPAATANRSVEINHTNGNITTTGTLTTAAVFAGIGEKAITDKAIPEGSLVVFEGEAGVRVAKDGELPDGVTTKALVMSIGGGIDPDNSPWVLDDMGNKLFEEVEVEDDGYFDGFNEGKDVLKKVQVPVKNPKYDPNKLVETENVEMLGRQWALNPNDLKVGEHMAGGHIAGRGFRVLAVKDDMALLLVGCSVGGEAA